MNRSIFIVVLFVATFLNGLTQPQERVFVHADKDTYLAGEIIWMKLYVVDAATKTPLALSRSAFVELLSDEQKPVLQARIALDTGLCNGSFQLPFSLRSGNYLLRAYTNWMKNFPADTWFEKRLVILNTLRNDRPAAGSSGRPPYDIQFFPEGGNSEAGLPCHIAFRIVDSTGRGIPCSGAVLGNTGDTLVRFGTQRFGMGEFIFTPAANTRYTAIVKTGAYPPTIHQLPEAEPAGYTMHVADAGNGRLQVNIHGHGNRTTARLLAYSHRLIATVETPLTGDSATFLLNKDSLPAGITWLTVLAGNNPQAMLPVCERGWFKAPIPLHMTVTSDRPAYGKREKITLQLSTAGPGDQPLQLHGSMAVVLQDSVQNNGEQDILNYLLLSADLKGTVESPQYYFSPQNADREELASLLLMTQGWRRLHLSGPTNRYLPEYGGLLVSGRITHRRTGAPAPDISAWLSAPGQHFQISKSTSDKDGYIFWDMGDLYGARELAVQPASNPDTSFRIEITPAFADQPTSSTPVALPMPQAPAAQLIQHGIGAQAQNAYRPALRQQFTRPAPADTTAFYGRPDKRYRLDEYTRFTTMEEVFREYIKEVRLRDKKGGFELYVQSDQANQLFFDDRPLVLIDGVPTANSGNLVHFDPLKIQKIEVVTKRYFVGGSLFDGIISCNTYQGDIAGFPLDGNTYTLDYDGWQLHREFYSPVYDTKDQQGSRIPDLRNVLYWSGDILTDSQGKGQSSFYSSDMPGHYKVILQGVTTDGKAGCATAGFTVADPRPRN